MGDLELSLDDIIKKKLKKTGLKRNRNNLGNVKKSFQPNRNSKNGTNISLNKNSRLTTSKVIRGQGAQPSIGDARNKIIQKQRLKMTDAREKLGQIAKQTDARLRLLKLRDRQRVGTIGVRSPSSRILTDPAILQRTVQPRLNNLLHEEELMDYSTDASYVIRSFPERAVMDDDVYNYPFRGRQDTSVLFRTVENDIPHSRLFEQEKSYTWSKPLLSRLDDYSDIPISRIHSRGLLGMSRNEDPASCTSSWDLSDTPIVITKKVKPPEAVGILKRSGSGSIFDEHAINIVKETQPLSKNKPPARTLSERFCQEGNLAAQKINMLKAKLEVNQKNNKNNSPDIQIPLGHRIVVSNLVPSVTHEDVKELFEDIGELISSKVVRPGTAEVVYKLHKDAVKAVDVYHNRQLDGQPMKCLLVNNRSTLAIASKSLKGVERKAGKTVVEVDMTAFRKALHKKSTS